VSRAHLPTQVQHRPLLALDVLQSQRQHHGTTRAAREVQREAVNRLLMRQPGLAHTALVQDSVQVALLEAQMMAVGHSTGLAVCLALRQTWAWVPAAWQWVPVVDLQELPVLPGHL